MFGSLHRPRLAFRPDWVTVGRVRPAAASLVLALLLAAPATGAVSFEQTPYPLDDEPGADAIALRLADLDGQHGLDIVATNYGGREVVVLLNQGNGVFGGAQGYSIHEPDDGMACATPQQLEIGQFNPTVDSYLDVMVSCFGPVARLFGDGTGQLGNLDHDTVSFLGGGPIELGEMNGGGAPELIYGGEAGGGNQYLTCMGSFPAGNFSFASCAETPMARRSSRLHRRTWTATETPTSSSAEATGARPTSRCSCGGPAAGRLSTSPTWSTQLPSWRTPVRPTSTGTA